MAVPTKIRDSVAFHLLKAVFVLYFAFTFVLTISHMLIEYRNTKSAISRELMLIHQSFSQSLSTALFELNKEQLQAIVDGMMTLPAVTGVQIETTGSSVAMSDALGTVIGADNRQVLIRRNATSSNQDELFWQDFTIYLQDTDQVLGTGRIYSNTRVVYQQVRDIFVIILGGAVLKTVALWLLFLWAARSHLNRPITVLTSIMSAMNFDAKERLKISFPASRKPGKVDIQFDFPGRFSELIEVHEHDEIHQLTTSFMRMNDSIQHKLNSLNLLSEMAECLINAKNNEAIFSEVHRVVSLFYPLKTMLVFLNHEARLPELIFQAEGSMVVPPSERQAPFDRRVIDFLFKQRTLVYLNQTEIQGLIGDDVSPHGFPGLHCLPLIDISHFLGSIILITADTELKADPEQELFLNAVSRLIVIAMRNNMMLAIIVEQSNSLGKEVSKRTEQLQMAVKELESFNYAVSHDLRAPLRHINGFLQMLSEEISPESSTQTQSLIERMHKTLDHMRELIEGMLKLAGAGHASLQIASVSLSELVAEVLAEVPAHVRARATIEVSSLPTVNADRTLLRQVIQNLIDNALKYSAHAHSPSVSIEQIVGTSQMRGIVVRDNGVGFEPQYADKLFMLFQRLHSAEDFPGTGVGLALTAKIINLHGGRIWAESSPGKGSSFYFTIPA